MTEWSRDQLLKSGFPRLSSSCVVSVSPALHAWSEDINSLYGLLFWWLSGKESACQCRRHGFDPRSLTIPHAAEQLSPLTHSLQSLSRVRLFATPWTAACQASLSVTSSRTLLSSCPLYRWCHPTISSSVVPFLPPSIFPGVRVFSDESALRIRWPKYQSFSFNISPSNEYSGLISFRIDWLDLLAGQGTLKSLLQHHSSKAHESQLLSLCSRTQEPQLLSPHAGTTEAQTPWSLCSPTKKPLRWEAHALPQKSSPCSLQLGQSPCSRKDPAQPKINT